MCLEEDPVLLIDRRPDGTSEIRIYDGTTLVIGDADVASSARAAVEQLDAFLGAALGRSIAELDQR